AAVCMQLRGVCISPRRLFVIGAFPGSHPAASPILPRLSMSRVDDPRDFPCDRSDTHDHVFTENLSGSTRPWVGCTAVRRPSQRPFARALACAAALAGLVSAERVHAAPSSTSPEQGYELGEVQHPRSVALAGAQQVWGGSTTAVFVNPANLPL